MEDHSDYLDSSVTMRIGNPQVVERLLREWNDQKRLMVLPNEREGALTAMLLELTNTGLVTVGRPASDVGRFAAYILVIGNVFRLSSPVKEAFDRVKEEIRQKLNLGLGELPDHRGPAAFHEISTEALIFPTAQVSEEEAKQRVVEHVARFYEDTWIHRPRRSLNNSAPVDAAGVPKLQRKLLGVIAFVEQCAVGGMVSQYDFNHLRRKLGLLDLKPLPSPPGPLSQGGRGAEAKQAPAGKVGDIGAMDAAELAALKPDALTEEELEKAYQTAYRLDAQELAAHFATTLVQRPVEGKSDRYPWFSFLIQRALRRGPTTQRWITSTRANGSTARTTTASGGTITNCGGRRFTPSAAKPMPPRTRING